MFIFTKSLLVYPVDYVPHTGRRFTISYEMKANDTSIYSASHFEVLSAQKDLFLDLFSSSVVQVEIYSGQFEPKRTSFVWTRPNSLIGLLLARHEQVRVESQSGGVKWIENGVPGQ